MTVRERLWAKASTGQRRAVAVGLASFVSRFYAKYDAGERYQLLQAQVAWLWDAVAREQPAGPAPVVAADADRFIPDVDRDPSPDAGIGAVAAEAVFAATEVITGPDAELDDICGLWDVFDECLEYASETEDDEAAYAAGLSALRGLSPDQIRTGVDALNRMPRKSGHAKRVRAAFRVAEAALREFLAQGGLMTAESAGHLRVRLNQVDTSTLRHP